MFLNRLMNQGNLPVVEQMLRFTAQRHQVLAENVANISTPNYQQKDLDPKAFQAALRDRVASRRGQPISSVRFDDMGASVEEPRRGMLFHDGANRSAEQLMSDLSRNALTHNLYVELMRRQFSSYDSALRERVG
jgi:flagellar basal-body rod protein FlgB